ncbi:hypothetical protein SDC9_126689 [bioreactor metagenome]|uniref:Uncharacterized protein n=1 Tax=bioreactor metagenome TaxID=1076179 RepID=A0A645CRD2_9ZZZZ
MEIVFRKSGGGEAVFADDLPVDGPLHVQLTDQPFLCLFAEPGEPPLPEARCIGAEKGFSSRNEGPEAPLHGVGRVSLYGGEAVLEAENHVELTPVLHAVDISLQKGAVGVVLQVFPAPGDRVPGDVDPHDGVDEGGDPLHDASVARAKLQYPFAAPQPAADEFDFPVEVLPDPFDRGVVDFAEPGAAELFPVIAGHVVCLPERVVPSGAFFTSKPFQGPGGIMPGDKKYRNRNPSQARDPSAMMPASG